MTPTFAPRNASRPVLALVLAVLLLSAGVLLWASTADEKRTTVIAFFDNTNGLFVGDEVRILGVPVGEINAIEPQPQRVKVTFWVNGKYRVPAEVNAVILSPSLVTSRAIQLTPAYVDGPVLSDSAVIPPERTAVPVEWDDFREQLERLTEALQPTTPGGVSSLGELINTTADNLRGQGTDIRNTVVELSQAISALGDHSTDIFSTVRNLSLLVQALQASTDLMRQLNLNLASTTALFADDPDEVGSAINDLNHVAEQVGSFVAENRETLGTTTDQLSAVSQTLTESLDDIEQLLHISPTVLANFVNVYQPAQGTLTGALSTNNLSDPLSFICGAVQAASRLGAEQSAKLCVQYLAPIVKNRQYSFFPIGLNPFVGAAVRPNEVTYSEDWMRPDYVPPPPPGAVSSSAADAPLPVATPPEVPPAVAAPQSAESDPLLPAEVPPVQTDPAAGLPGLMTPTVVGP